MAQRRDLEAQLADATARGLVATAEEIRRQIERRDSKSTRRRTRRQDG